MRKNLSKADTMRLKTYRAMINAGSKHLAYGSKKWRTFTRYMFDQDYAALEKDLAGRPTTVSGYSYF